MEWRPLAECTMDYFSWPNSLDLTLGLLGLLGLLDQLGLKAVLGLLTTKKEKQKKTLLTSLEEIIIRPSLWKEAIVVRWPLSHFKPQPLWP